MKIIRKAKPVRGKKAIRAASPEAQMAGAAGKALRKRFSHPFRLEFGGTYTKIEWDCGPKREEVWDYLIHHFPQLACQQILTTLRWLGYETRGGYIEFPFPFALKRHDLFNAAIEDFPRLVKAGANFEEKNEDGTPLYAAAFFDDDERALALARAGADVEHYGPSGDFWPLTCNLPSFRAYIESLLIDGETHPVPPKQFSPRRL